MTSLSFRQLFLRIFALSVVLLATSSVFAWTGPTATAPGANVAAPINTGTTDQVKDAGISVNSFAVFGSQYIEDKLGINKTSPVVALHVVGTAIFGNGGETCQAVTEGAQRYNSSTKEMEFCNGTEWGPIGSNSPLEIAAYANFSDSTGTPVINDSYHLSITKLGYGYYQVDMSPAPINKNYLVFFSPSYDGGAAYTMWEVGARTASTFKFYCTHGGSGNRYCGDYASVMVMVNPEDAEEDDSGAVYTMYQAQGSPGSCGWSTSPTYCSTSEFSDACWDNISTIGQCEEGVNCPVMPGHTAGQQIGSCPAPL